MHLLKSLVRLESSNYVTFAISRVMNTHITVLTDEAVEALAITSSSTIVDATLGSFGHARRIIQKLDTTGTFIGVDIDNHAIVQCANEFEDALPHVHFVNDNFRNISSILKQLHHTKVDGILADLGWRLEQFSESNKGFSFQKDEPLVMTLGNPEQYVFTAHDIVNTWDEENIVRILTGYGEERFAKRIAKKIVEKREVKSIETTAELVTIIMDAVPSFYAHGKIHPATRTFQALRIAVNDELRVLEQFIPDAINALSSNGRLVIITFHSLEDRIVKHLFRTFAHDQVGRVLTKKPIVPTDAELIQNPRARSAKMRVFEKS